MDMIRRQKAIRSEASIDGLTRLSIDDVYEYLPKRLVTVKLLKDELDEINFSQCLIREEFSQRLEEQRKQLKPDLECTSTASITFRKECRSMMLISRY
ncbi:hypothetical protein DY000_02021544 [Brassica cretica]|uniref:Uncharacterized protein n=1 Tax=Brassica cretica TaxID=69181 RepID=A0ABQ7DZH5_BRACR|nr:hypothetical protein DY000_02021544 [Brassica cretica]